MLRIEKLYKRYNRKENALDGLDMEVEKGELYRFLPPTTPCTTTTLRIITGLLKPDSGEIWLDGQRTTKDMKLQKSMIGFVPDFFGLYENLTVIEYLEFFAAAYGIYQKAGTVRSYEVLELVNLRGMEEVFVDEPNSGLDPRTRKEFQLLLQQLQKEGYTILISSHILSELSDMCTSIGIINQGKMVLQGKIDHIMLSIDSSNPLRITVLNKIKQAVRLIRANPQVERISVEENKIAAWFSGSREEEARLLRELVDAGILVVAFAREHNSLESLFFHLTGGVREGEEV